jgi:hypothetical protein
MRPTALKMSRRQLECWRCTDSQRRWHAFALPDFRKTPRWALNRPLRPAAELKCGADWHIPATSAKIASGFSLEAHGTRLALCASPRGRIHLSSKYTARCLQANGLVQHKMMDLATPHLLFGNLLAWVICPHLRSPRLPHATQVPGLARRLTSMLAESITRFLIPSATR